MKILLSVLLLLVSVITFANEQDKETVLNVSQITSLENVVGKKETFEFFVSKNTDAYDYFNQIGGYSRKNTSLYITYMATAKELYPPLWAVKAIKQSDEGSFVTVDITKEKRTFFIEDIHKAYYIEYAYDYGLLTKTNLYIVVDGDKNDERKQTEYLLEKLDKYFKKEGYDKEANLLTWLNSFNNDNSYNYVKGDNVVNVKFAYLKSYISTIKISFQNEKFNKQLPELTKESDKKRYADKFDEILK